MTIYRFSSAEGYPIDEGQSHIDAFQAMAEAPDVDVYKLSPDEYDLTPAAAMRGSYTHNVLVHPDGTATYRAIATRESAVIATEDSGGPSALKAGGFTIRLPADQPATLIIGHLPGETGSRIFEAIMYNDRAV